MNRLSLFFVTLYCLCNSLFGHTSQKNYFLTDSVINTLSPNSLNRYAYIVYSQFGEDGIIEEVFRRLNIKEGFFVEFGAADGIWLSNTRYLWEKGWSGAMIEADSNSYKQLAANYAHAENVVCINRYVGWDVNDPTSSTLDQIAMDFFPDKEIDLLSIDIDGLDYLILKSLKMRPKVIMIENNLYWHPLFDKEVPKEIAAKNLQQPLPVMINIAKSMGYEPVCLTINLFLVRKDLYASFKETPSDPLTLWMDGFLSNPNRRLIAQERRTNPFVKRYEDPKWEKSYPTPKQSVR